MKRKKLLFLCVMFCLSLMMSISVQAASKQAPIYKEFLLNHPSYTWFRTLDINKDGVKELLLLNGTCEADYVYKIYTIGNGSARYIDEVNGSCVMFYEDENGGTEKYIISVQARMGCERVSKIWLKDGKVSTEEISYKEEVGIDEDYYSNPYPLDYADVTDKSLLK